jgi:hypothetical protein
VTRDACLQPSRAALVSAWRIIIIRENSTLPKIKKKTKGATNAISTVAAPLRMIRCCVCRFQDFESMDGVVVFRARVFLGKRLGNMHIDFT